MSSVCLRLGQFSQLSFMQYMGLCVVSLPIYTMMIGTIHVLYLIIIKFEVWPIWPICMSLYILTIAFS